MLLGWQPMDSAPKDETRIDVWAKTWVSATDQFIFRRFPDCYFSRPFDSTFDSPKTELKNIAKDWVPTHWMPLPEAPGPERDTPLHRIWVRRDRDWAKASGQYTVTTDMRTLSPPEDPKGWIEFVENRPSRNVSNKEIK